MPDQPDDTQQQQRRSTAHPPFFAPRTSRPTTPSQSGTAAPPRRSSQLFTPPGVAKQPRPTTPPATLPATRRMTPFAVPVVPPAPLAEAASFEPPALPTTPSSEAQAPAGAIEAAMPEAAAQETSVPLAEVPLAEVPQAEVPHASMPEVAMPEAAPAEMPNEEQRGATHEGGDGFVIEQFEQTPISLRPTGDHAAVQEEGTMSFQVYDDASRLLERDAGPAPTDDDGAIEIERTEVMFEPAAQDSRLEVESFWAAESIQAAVPPSQHADDAAPLGTEPVAEAAAEPEAMERVTQPVLAAIEPMAAAPEAAIAAPAHAGPALAGPDDAEEALAEAFSEPAPNETVPRWATPRANRAVEDQRPTQPNDGWNLAAPAQPPDELAAALAWPDSGLRAPTPAGVAVVEGTSDTSHELAASAEGWPLSVAGRPGAPDAVASALERIAQRVRAGEVPLPADVALAKSDESALALTLAALLRAGSPRA